jgi:hypothetical protein
LATNSSRIWLLAGIAVSLLGVVGLRYFPGDGAAARNDEAVRARMETLRRVVAGGAAVTAEYAEVGTAFAERFADVKSYQTHGKVRHDAIIAIIRGEIESVGQFQNLAITPVTDSPSGDGIIRSTINVSFVSADDRKALEAIRRFGRPETGIAWQSLSVAADRKERHVTVTGKLIALAVDAVE